MLSPQVAWFVGLVPNVGCRQVSTLVHTNLVMALVFEPLMQPVFMVALLAFVCFVDPPNSVSNRV